MGSDTTELELSVESRSFVNRVYDEVRKSNNLGNVHGGDDECSNIHGKEFPG